MRRSCCGKMRAVLVATLFQLSFSNVAAFSRSFSPFQLQIKPSGSQTLFSTLNPQELSTITDERVVNRPTYQPLLLDDEDSSDFTSESTSPVKKIRKGSEPEFAIAGDSTTETPAQVAVVASHFVVMFANLVLAASVTPLTSAVDIFSLFATFVLSVVLGDFGTGVFHWATDNYGSIKTPVFGSVCAAFQGHHVTPWTITFRSFANNVYKICYGTVPALLLVAVTPMGPLPKIFFTLFITWWMISQELHKFSHMRSTPKTIKFFQDAGIILSKKEHGLHHTAPFEGHYCILTGVCNSFLDDSKFFRHMENLVFKFTGIFPNDSSLSSTLFRSLTFFSYAKKSQEINPTHGSLTLSLKKKLEECTRSCNLICQMHYLSSSNFLLDFFGASIFLVL